MAVPPPKERSDKHKAIHKILNDNLYPNIREILLCFLIDTNMLGVYLLWPKEMIQSALNWANREGLL